VRSPADLKRIRALAIPPAWKDVWISSDPKSHLQATGRDKRGRKQYRYHREWRACRDSNKLDRLETFAAVLKARRCGSSSAARAASGTTSTSAIAASRASSGSRGK